MRCVTSVFELLLAPDIDVYYCPPCVALWRMSTVGVVLQGVTTV